MNGSLDLTEVAAYVRAFAAERDWDQFHTPKNLSMALAGEAGELLEIFQWLTPERSANLDDQTRQHVGEELVDILQYAVRIADLLDVDLNEAFWAKVYKNTERYPADQVRGRTEKR